MKNTYHCKFIHDGKITQEKELQFYSPEQAASCLLNRLNYREVPDYKKPKYGMIIRNIYTTEETRYEIVQQKYCPTCE